MILDIPVRADSITNVREHWAVKARRAKEQRHATALAFLEANGRPRRTFTDPLEITITRVAPRPLDDDNLRSALKHVRDEVATCYGVDDRDPRIEWRYAQARGEPKHYAVLVEIRALVEVQTR